MATRAKNSAKLVGQEEQLSRLLAGNLQDVIERSLKGGNLSDAQLAKSLGVSEEEITKAKADLDAWKKQNEGKQVVALPDSDNMKAVWFELFGRTHNIDGSPRTAGQPSAATQVANQGKAKGKGKGQGGKDEESKDGGKKQPAPWYTKRGAGFASIIFGKGKGPSDPMYSVYGGGSAAGGGGGGAMPELPESVKELIAKERRRSSRSTGSAPSAPSAPSGGGSAPSGGGGGK